MKSASLVLFSDNSGKLVKVTAAHGHKLKRNQ